MATEQSRGRMAKIAKTTERYPCDLTDEEWEQIAPLMPKPGGAAVRRLKSDTMDHDVAPKTRVDSFASCSKVGVVRQAGDRHGWRRR